MLHIITYHMYNILMVSKSHLKHVQIPFFDQLCSMNLYGFSASHFRAGPNDIGCTSNTDRNHCFGENDDEHIEFRWVDGVLRLKEICERQ